MLNAVDDALAERWSNTDELLATLVELIDNFRLTWIRANSERGASLPDPIRIARPYQKKSEPVKLSPGDLMRRMRGVGGG